MLRLEIRRKIKNSTSTQYCLLCVYKCCMYQQSDSTVRTFWSLNRCNKAIRSRFEFSARLFSIAAVIRSYRATVSHPFQKSWSSEQWSYLWRPRVYSCRYSGLIRKRPSEAFDAIRWDWILPSNTNVSCRKPLSHHWWIFAWTKNLTLTSS